MLMVIFIEALLAKAFPNEVAETFIQFRAIAGFLKRITARRPWGNWFEQCALVALPSSARVDVYSIVIVMTQKYQS